MIRERMNTGTKYLLLIRTILNEGQFICLLLKLKLGKFN